MANSISSDLTIATAVEALSNMLAPIGAFTLNAANEAAQRASTIKVPVVSVDDSARVFDSNTGYTATSDSSASTVNVVVNEEIKPFHLSDNELNKSPLTLQSYVRANANEFGRHLLRKIFDAVDGSSAVLTAKAKASVALGDVQGLVGGLDGAAANLERSLIINAAAHSALLPADTTIYGADVVRSGRIGQLYGMDVYPTTVGNVAATKAHTFAVPNDAIVIANRIPDVQGANTLEEFTPFEVEGLGLTCAYRRFYDARNGEHYGAFTTMFGVGIAQPSKIKGFKNT